MSGTHRRRVYTVVCEPPLRQGHTAVTPPPSPVRQRRCGAVELDCTGRYSDSLDPVFLPIVVSHVLFLGSTVGERPVRSAYQRIGTSHATSSTDVPILTRGTNRYLIHTNRRQMLSPIALPDHGQGRVVDIANHRGFAAKQDTCRNTSVMQDTEAIAVAWRTAQKHPFFGRIFVETSAG